ncbi:MAG: zinc ribbon domain-containing protein [Opitutaceae bacterium]
MPTYEYACRLCDHQFEVFQSIKADPLSQCPSCGEEGLRRLIGLGAGIIFKGSGFYETDYKRESSKAPVGESGAGSTSGETTTPAKSEPSKPSTESSSSAGKSDT